MKQALALASIFFAACATKYSPSPAGDDDVDPPPPTEVDAPVAEIDGAPVPKPYPAGPYGTKTGDTIDNLTWQGFSDTPADEDGDPFNETAHAVTLESFFAERDPGSKILMITSSAGWCGPCQEEASHMRALAEEWGPKGVRFMTAMMENASGSPASVNYAKTWGTNFDLLTPVVADPQVILDPYFVDNGIPFNLFIDTTTMKIVSKMSGFDRAEAEAIFNDHVN
jgi:thiol-disulfide isomerase/thioredoxin